MFRWVNIVLVMAFYLGSAMLIWPARAEDAADEVSCEPACEGLVCGDDSCGGSCGVCAAYHGCQQGQCVFDGGCQPESVSGCGGCACEICTCQLDPYCCMGQWDALCVSRCNSQCGGCGVLAKCGDGNCTPGEDCTSCAVDCGSCPPDCGPVTSKGCCAESTLLQCVGGVLKIIPCTEPDAEGCGWSIESGQYECGGNGSDPDGLFPLTCTAAPEEDLVETTPDPACDEIGFAGCCEGATAWWCDAGGFHSLDCADNAAPFQTCGWHSAKGYYDCGGKGADPSGNNPLYCSSIPEDAVSQEVVDPECKVGVLVAVGCEDISWEGCCTDTAALLFCESGKYLCSLECSGLVFPANTCGWVAGTPGYYDCGGEDGDPSGEFPLVCPPVDGPLPDISIDSAPGPDCPEIPDGGCCDGTLLIWCENGVDRTFDCTGLSEDPIFHDYLFCGTNPTSGMADCLKKPDPSPPECGGGSVEPEPPVEGIGEDLTTVDEDGPETMETMSEIGTDDKNSELSDDWTLEGGGITIPVEESTQPPGKKKNKGCSGAPVGSNACGWLTFLVLLLIIRLLGRRRPV